MKSGIYIITHLASGMVYIGSSVDVTKRLKEHKRDLKAKRHHSPRLQNFFSKYGMDAFTFVLLEEVEIDSLLNREQHWMDHYESHNRNKGFNIYCTAGSPLGYKHTEEHKRKLSILFSGENNMFYGKQHTDETKRIIGEKNRTRFKGTRLKEENPFYGKKHSEETLNNYSEKRKGSLNPKAKLTESIVKEIKRSLANGAVGAELGRKYGVNKNTISKIKVGSLWGYVTID